MDEFNQNNVNQGQNPNNQYQQYQQQGQYHQSPNQFYSDQYSPIKNMTELAPVVTTKEWLKKYLFMLIPIVGFIMMFVWAFASGRENPNIKNWARANLIYMAIIYAVLIVLMIIVLIVTFAILETQGYYYY